MKKNIANSISVVLHPMLMPLLGLFLIFNSGTAISFAPSAYRMIVYLVIFGVTFVLPLSMIPVLIYFKLIDSVRMESHKERILPLFTSGVFYLFGYIFLKKIGIPLIINQFMLGSLVAIVIALVVSYWWKISIHLTGIGGVIGVVFMLSAKAGLGITLPLVILFIVAALLASARLYLNAHTPNQTLAGFALGFVSLVSVSILI